MDYFNNINHNHLTHIYFLLEFALQLATGLSSSSAAERWHIRSMTTLLPSFTPWHQHPPIYPSSIWSTSWPPPKTCLIHASNCMLTISSSLLSQAPRLSMSINSNMPSIGAQDIQGINLSIDLDKTELMKPWSTDGGVESHQGTTQQRNKNVFYIYISICISNLYIVIGLPNQRIYLTFQVTLNFSSFLPFKDRWRKVYGDRLLISELVYKEEQPSTTTSQTTYTPAYKVSQD